MNNPFLTDDEDFYIEGEDPIEAEDSVGLNRDLAGVPLINSEIDFAELGLDDVAYVKAVTINGRPGFTIHAADGTPMAMTNDHDLAIAAVIQNDLLPMSVH